MQTFLRPRTIQLLLLGCFLACFFEAAVVAGAEKYALLIGVTRYRHAEMNKPRLKFPEEDARALGKFLSDAGYEVEYLLGEQAKRQAVLAALEKLKKKGSDDGVVVVGMFGHGVEAPLLQPDGKRAIEGCFCPWDTEVEQAVRDGNKLFNEEGQPMMEPVSGSLIAMRDVLNNLSTSGAGSRVVFADCCREMPNRARGRNLGLGASFKARDLPENAAVFFGCASGSIAYERDDWGHGAFTKCLLEELQALSLEGDVTTGTLGDRVKKKVRALTVSSREGPQDPQPFQTNSIDLQIVSLRPQLLTAPFTAPEAQTAQRAWATHLKLEPILTNQLGMRLALIPPGEFMMGSPETEEDRSDDETLHRVRITEPYYVGIYEVTQAEWESLMGNQPSYFSRNGGGSSSVSGQDTSRFPVETISWDDATEFCRRLSAREGKTYRLPTEAEWEYACRAGTTTPFHFGSILNGEQANVDGNGPYGTSEKGPYLQRTTRVGSYRANAFGLYDMSGNVWEWCQDYYNDSFYRQSPIDNPLNSSGEGYRVLRGGSWYNYARNCRSAYRNWYTPTYRGNYRGVRVVCELR